MSVVMLVKTIRTCIIESKSHEKGLSMEKFILLVLNQTLVYRAYNVKSVPSVLNRRRDLDQIRFERVS